MVLNFGMSKGRPRNPARLCRKIAGEPIESQIRQVVTAIIGAIQTRAAAAIRISVSLLRFPVILGSLLFINHYKALRN